ncbi:MAG TPA: TrmH family RNA methyltransferase [Bacteroidales bacterium]|jgi:tRNA G18 (ribose-2'-O)-methylase SpoU|nr:methyltransferase [Bacteroidota bacterium]HJN07003.1 TrmH family RNA methyltransferase [Bacteroidales bacterium]|tara:strand:+ start:732 stop:1250 length:519 start_codon:yes stop_codon:yes gene_type:complete
MKNSSVDLFNKLGTSEILKGVSQPIIIADRLRTPENIGLILRLAGNINALNTLFISDEGHKFKKYKIIKTASGAVTKVDWKIIKPAELEDFLPNDYKIVALETCKDASSIFSFKFPKKVAFMVGNEVHGISEEMLSIAHQKVYIPVPGPISSLNVTHALSIALFEWLKQIQV